MSLLLWPFKLAFGTLQLALGLLVLASCVLTGLAFLGQGLLGWDTAIGGQNWLWGLTTHFRMQYLVIQILAIVFLVLSAWSQSAKKQPDKRPSWLRGFSYRMELLVLLIFAGLNLWPMLPYYWPSAQTSASQGAKGITLLHCNLFGLINHDTHRVLDTIRTVDPDMLDLVEYTESWRRSLEGSGVLKRYPYRITGHGHIALYSKLPLQNGRLAFTDSSEKVANNANIIANFKLNRQLVTILVAHPASPIMPSHLQWMRDSFQHWAKQRKQLGRNLIIVGDLNTTPWSAEFSELTQRTGLRDSQIGFGVQPSWPMLLPLIGVRETPNWLTSVLQIPIDHVLVSPNIVVLSRRTGPFIGSDHLPVIAELGIKARS